MPRSLKTAIRWFVFVAVVVIASALVGGQMASTQNPADEGCTNGRVPCPDVACVSGCWADGTFPQNGSKVRETAFAPAECGIGAHGCITQSCHH